VGVGWLATWECPCIKQAQTAVAARCCLVHQLVAGRSTDVLNPQAACVMFG